MRDAVKDRLLPLCQLESAERNTCLQRMAQSGTPNSLSAFADVRSPSQTLLCAQQNCLDAACRCQLKLFHVRLEWILSARAALHCSMVCKDRLMICTESHRTSSAVLCTIMRRVMLMHDLMIEFVNMPSNANIDSCVTQNKGGSRQPGTVLNIV